jgi:hypothetical protein
MNWFGMTFIGLRQKWKSLQICKDEKKAGAYSTSIYICRQPTSSPGFLHFQSFTGTPCMIKVHAVVRFKLYKSCIHWLLVKLSLLENSYFFGLKGLRHEVLQLFHHLIVASTWFIDFNRFEYGCQLSEVPSLACGPWEESICGGDSKHEW